MDQKLQSLTKEIGIHFVPVKRGEWSAEIRVFIVVQQAFQACLCVTDLRGKIKQACNYNVLNPPCDDLVLKLYSDYVILSGSKTYPPDTQVVATGGKQVWVYAFGVGNPHNFGGWVGVVKSISADEL